MQERRLCMKTLCLTKHIIIKYRKALPISMSILLQRKLTIANIEKKVAICRHLQQYETNRHQWGYRAVVISPIPLRRKE